MKKLEMKSPDLTMMNIERIGQLFPNAITEAMDNNGNLKKAIDFDLLRQELSSDIVDGEKERYQLTWPGKKEAILNANTPVNKTLRPVKEDSVDWDTTQNLYIEGDNLEVLKLLQESYLNKIKCIYIDPPYNTGSDFVYRDNFSQDKAEYIDESGQIDEEGNRLFQNTESNGRFHSDWLTMMYPRLRIARNLLSEDGIIYISIDDGEVGNLRKVADEVFGENNLIANVIWQKKYTRSNDAKWFSDNHDHILCYCKDKHKTALNLLPRNDDQLAAYSNPDGHPKGRWKATPLHAKSGTNTLEYKFKNGTTWKPPVGTYRRFRDETMQRMDENNEIWFGVDACQTPSRKTFLCEVKDGVTPVTLWPYDEVGHNHEANNELKDLQIGGLFNNPKPTRLLKRALILATNPNCLILDFFSGSATTAHAVMQLNAEDGGNRKYIMVQIPEETPEDSEAYKAGYKNICEIGKERVRRAAKKIKEETKADIDYGFRVFRVDSSNMKDVYYTPDKLGQQDLFSLVTNIKDDRTEEDLLSQIMLEFGLELSLPIETRAMSAKKVFFVAGNSLAACLEKEIPETVIREIAAEKPLRSVFRDSSFKNDAARINVEEIFKMISPSTEIRVI